MRYPEFLKKNGRIGYIAPSFGCTIEPYQTLFDKALRRMADAGYTNILGPNCYKEEGIGKSNTSEKCAAEINDFFTEDRSDIVLSCGGGETMCEDLSFVDFERIRKAKPKWYMGYSDNTNLTVPLATLADTASVYGPNAPDFGRTPSHSSLEDAMDVLTGKNLTVHGYDKWELEEADRETNPLAPYNCTEPNSMHVYIPDGKGGQVLVSENPDHPADREVTFSGRLLGGCLDVLGIQCGTRFDAVKEFAERYKEDGIVWFMEACELNSLSVKRVLWQLEEAGWFRYVKGFLFGRPMLYSDASLGLTQDEAVLSVLGKYGVPILTNLDFGHLPPHMPLITGAVGHVETKDGKLTIRHELI